MHPSCVLKVSRHAFLLISYFSPKNSLEVSRSRGHLGNKSYQFAAIATQTQIVCLRCIRQFVEVIMINYPNINCAFNALMIS